MIKEGKLGCPFCKVFDGINIVKPEREREDNFRDKIGNLALYVLRRAKVTCNRPAKKLNIYLLNPKKNSHLKLKLLKLFEAER